MNIDHTSHHAALVPRVATMSAASLRGRLRPREIVIIKLLPDQQLALLVPMLHDDAGLASDGLVFCFHTQWVQPVAAIAVISSMFSLVKKSLKSRSLAMNLP